MKAKTIIVATKDVMTRVAVDCSAFNVMFGSVVDDVKNLESITIYPESEVERRVMERVDKIDAARKAVDTACNEYCEDDVASTIDCENYRRGKPCKLVDDLQKANAELKSINDTPLASEKDEKIASLEAETKELESELKKAYTANDAIKQTNENLCKRINFLKEQLSLIKGICGKINYGK